MSHGREARWLSRARGEVSGHWPRARTVGESRGEVVEPQAIGGEARG